MNVSVNVNVNPNGATHATDPTDQSRIVRFLARVDRRLRLNELVEALSLGLWALAGLLVAAKIATLWDRANVRDGLLLVYLVALAAFLVWSFARRKGLAGPATVADARADAKDAFKSSLDFIQHSDRTRWMQFQIRRTADLSDGLAPEEMAPFSLPRRFLPAIGVVALFSALLAWNPSWLRNVDANVWLEAARARTAALTAEAGDEAAASPDEAESEPEKLEDLEEARDRLRRGELAKPETLRDLEEAQQALAASRMDMDRLQMDLESLAKQLESAPSLGELAKAMKSNDPQKAAELLRALADKLSKSPQSSEEMKALLEALKNANVQEADLAQLMESLEKGQAEMTPEAMEQMAKALQQAADQLQNAGQQMAANQSLDPSAQQQSLQSGLGQQQGAGQQQMGGEQQSGAQAMQSASGMMSSQLQMAQFQGDPSNAVPVDAGPAGDSTGPGGGEQQVLGEATTLDVQLEMEVLKTEKKEEPVPEEVFERLSRQEKSTLNYEAVSQRRTYDDETALHHENVPWPYRSLVKRYFMSILSNAEAKSESGSEK